METLVISPLEIADDAVEIVERKGLGHPDTICDALAETLSRNLAREYRARFGSILHHNVDKALLRGGMAAPAFGGGTVLAPIEIYLAGRVVLEAGGKTIPIKDIAVEGSRAWLRANLHALDAERHVLIHELVRPGSHDLRAVFSGRSGQGVQLANDTSIGVGYAPMSALEQLVLAVERRINGRSRVGDHPAWGEDIKVMGVRNGNRVHLTIACALIGRHIAHMDDYLAEKTSIEELARELAALHGFAAVKVTVNAADDRSASSVYLTVTGTSAEAGDDGQVGRGNRVNGLITPCRPMSLEAAAGKNPLSHVGKIYNVVSREVAQLLVTRIPGITAAHCLMVSQIGAPLNKPALVHIKLAPKDHAAVFQWRKEVLEIVANRLSRIRELVEDLISGKIEVF